MPTPLWMDWKSRFPVGLALLAALMLAGGVSAATSMKLASVHNEAAVTLGSHDESHDPGESDDPGESKPTDESEPTEQSEPPEGSEPTEGDDEPVPGGSVERFHEGCELPEGAAALEGNWTHGQYVSAFAKADDHDALVAAAHSPCGKPMKAAEHGTDEENKAHGNSNSAGKSGQRGKSKKHHS